MQTPKAAGNDPGEGVLQEIFASESDLNPSRAEEPLVEVTLVAGAGWGGLAEPHRPLTEQHRSPPASFWHWVIFSFIKRL